MAHSQELAARITKKIKFLGRVVVLPGENELEALALGALRVMRGDERARNYPDGAYL